MPDEGKSIPCTPEQAAFVLRFGNGDGCLGIRGIKVVESRDGLFVSMPSRKTENGYKEICFPVTKSSGSSSIRRC